MEVFGGDENDETLNFEFCMGNAGVKQKNFDQAFVCEKKFFKNTTRPSRARGQCPQVLACVWSQVRGLFEDLGVVQFLELDAQSREVERAEF